MLRFAPLLLLLTAAPALGMDMASMEAIISSCQKGQICSCPRAKIARIGKSACGPEPEWILDGNSLAIDPNGNAKNSINTISVCKKCSMQISKLIDTMASSKIANVLMPATRKPSSPICPHVRSIQATAKR